MSYRILSDFHQKLVDDCQQPARSNVVAIDGLIQALAPPRPTMDSSHIDLVHHVCANLPPRIPAACVANERDCENTAAYLINLHAAYVTHVDAVLRNLRAHLHPELDVSEYIGTLDQFSNNIVSLKDIDVGRG